MFERLCCCFKSESQKPTKQIIYKNDKKVGDSIRAVRNKGQTNVPLYPIKKNEPPIVRKQPKKSPQNLVKNPIFSISNNEILI